MRQKRISDYGYRIGHHESGPRNKITDVPGVRVGHATVESGNQHTGVTVIVPGEGNPFLKKYLASAYVHNGFGKTCGLVQVQELGTLETPIALTNTLNVGKVADAMISWMIQQTRKEGEDVFSINPVVGECNDSRINEICNRVVGEKELYQALEQADTDFAEGDIGAGTGSVSIEIARAGEQIRVYAIEKNPEGVKLIDQNRKKFRTDGVRIIEGLAQQALEELETPTHAFVGGSSGNLREIVQLLQRKNPDVRIVINAISLETVSEVMGLVDEGVLPDAEILQVGAARSKVLGRYHMMMGQNPVYIISAGGRKPGQV